MRQRDGRNQRLWRALAVLATAAAGAAAAPGDAAAAENGAGALHCPFEILVTDPTGARIPGAYVQVAGPVDQRGSTDAEGRFCVEAGRAGRYGALVEKTGFEKKSATFVPGQTASPLVVELVPAPVRQAVEVVAAPDLAAEAVDRIPAGLLETPRSITVIDANQLRERNFRDVHQLLAFIPGMGPNSFRTGGYHFYARGFRMGADDVRVDGATGAALSGSYSVSTFGVEQVVACGARPVFNTALRPRRAAS